MDILDIKRRIIYMTAAVKYISILARNNHIITDDEIQTLVRGSIKALIDTDFETKDLMKLAEQVSSILITNKKEIIETSAKFSFDTKPVQFIDINELIELNEETLVAKAVSKLIKANANEIKASDYFKLSVAVLKEMQMFDTITVADKNSFNTAKSFVAKYFGYLYMQDKIIADTVNSMIFSSNSVIIVDDKAALIKAVSELFEISENLGFYGRTNVIDGIGSVKFKINQKIETSAYLEFKGYDRVPIEIYDGFEINDSNLIDTLRGIELEIRQELQIEDNVEIEITAITPIHFTINSEFSINDLINIIPSNSKGIQIGDYIIVESDTIISPDIAKHIINNQNIIIENSFLISLYRPALIQDYANQKIGNFKNKEIFDFLYILQE